MYFTKTLEVKIVNTVQAANVFRSKSLCTYLHILTVTQWH